MPRNFRREYDKFQSSPSQIADRSSRNKARRKMVAAGKAHKGDGQDVDHADGNPRHNGRGNLHMMSKSKNRAKK